MASWIMYNVYCIARPDESNTVLANLYGVSRRDMEQDEEKHWITLYDKSSGICNVDCPVCYKTFTDMSEIMNWPCSHALCRECGLKWTAYDRRARCVVCRGE